MLVQIWISLSIFLIVYAVIVTERFHRALAAWIGAMLMVVCGFLQVEELASLYIDWKTILFIISLMILMGTVQQTNILPYLALRILRIVKAKPLYIFVLLFLLTGIYAALLGQLVAVLTLVPLTLTVTRIMKVNAVPYLLSGMFAVHLGGTLTLIGSIPNLLIAGANDSFTYWQFVDYLAPIIGIMSVVILVVLIQLYRKELVQPVEEYTAIDSINIQLHKENSPRLRVTLFLLILTLLGLLLHDFLNIEAATIAICGAILIICFGSKKIDVEQSTSLIDMNTIFLITGLYALVGGMQHVQVFRPLIEQALTVSEGHLLLASSVILWGSGILSFAFDNWLYVTAMIPILESYQQGLLLLSDPSMKDVLWWSLVLGSGMGGTASLIASPVNLIVVGLLLKQKQKIQIRDFMKVGIPLTIVCFLFAQGYLVLRFYLTFAQ